jgi:hypothetical protein
VGSGGIHLQVRTRPPFMRAGSCPGRSLVHAGSNRA